MRDELVPEVDVSLCGPCMLAITAQQRRFVVAWIALNGKSAARAARKAGYSDVAGGAKVRASELMRDRRICAAIKEECERTLQPTAGLALLAMEALVLSKDEKVRLKAVDSVLDRTGYGRASSQNIRVEKNELAHVPDAVLARTLRQAEAEMGREKFEQFCRDLGALDMPAHLKKIEAIEAQGAPPADQSEVIDV